MSRVTLSLPEHLRAFVDREVAAGGYASAAEYVALLVQKAHLAKHRKQIEALLREGLESGPAIPLNDEAWQAIGLAGQERLAKEKRHAGKSNKHPRRPKRPA